MLGIALAFAMQGLLPRPAAAWAIQPRQRVIIDNDFSGDPDGLFQLAHHLASPSVDIRLVVGSHIHENDFLDQSATQADNAVARVNELYAQMKLARRPPVVAGRNAAWQPGAPPAMTTAARMIIAEALRDDTPLPLYYAAGAGLTDLAEAIRLEPRVASRLTLVWIGGMEHGDLLPGVPPRRDSEYNLTIDLLAAQFVFNQSGLPIWQIPRNVYRQLNLSDAELSAGLRHAGALGRYLSAQIERVRATVKANLGETYILGDSPLVTVTALQSSFEPDSSSSAYVLRPTPHIADDGSYVPVAGGRPMRIYTAIDTRLTLSDMFAKFAASGK
ncbi:MAG: nucleoside hydrolase [Burkholderiaceae bacterium]|nr:nucleoside hydrolase [Burkholderiaceae bacterium]